MHYAMVDGERCEATPGLKGQCPLCGGLVDAKCGDRRIYHWAHRGKRSCDPWSENETEWHRRWKSYFPQSWQEVVHRAEDGEKHIADVKTPSGPVLEFQHSYLKPQERASRETFYRNMVWVVDGTGRKDDSRQFATSLKRAVFRRKRIYLTDWHHTGLLAKWRDQPVPVFFDFGRRLYCLLPNRIEGYAAIVAVRRSQFVERCLRDEVPCDVGALTAEIEDLHSCWHADKQRNYVKRFGYSRSLGYGHGSGDRHPLRI